MRATISFKITLSIAAVVLCALLATGYSIILMNSQASKAVVLDDDLLPLVSMSSLIKETATTVSSGQREYSLTGSPESLTVFSDAQNLLDRQVFDLKTYAGERPHLGLDERIAEFEASYNSYKQAVAVDNSHTKLIYSEYAEMREHISVALESGDEVYMLAFDVIYDDIYAVEPTALRVMRVIDHSGDVVDRSNDLEIAIGDVMSGFSVPLLEEVNSLFADMTVSVAELAGYVETDEEREVFGHIQSSMTGLNPLIADFNTGIKAIAPVRRNTLDAESVMLKNLADFDAYMQEMLAGSIANTSDTLSHAVLISLALGLFMLLIGAVAIVYLRRSVMGQIHRFVELTRDLTSGDGDLTKRIEVSSNDELADLARYFSHFISSVHDIIAQVKEASESVASGNSELAATMEELSTTFDEQANQISELVESINDIRSSSQVNSESLEANYKIMSETIEESESGKSELNGTLKRMQAISQQTASLLSTVNNLATSTEQIENILEIINNIADQTNLLALNAAIEAARAGDAGKGFAVVAYEVRNLAERTQKATLEVDSIIEQLVKESRSASEEVNSSATLVTEGVESMNTTNAIFTDITSKIGQAGSKISAVNQSIFEQHGTIRTVSDNAAIITDSIEKSNIAVSEVTKTVEHLQSQADHLKMLVSRFKTS